MCKPLALALGAMMSTSALAQSQSRFIVVSDYHFDALADPAIVPQLLDHHATDWQAIFESGKTLEFADFGNDANYPLFQSSLDAIGAVGHDANFILYPGDFVMHHLERDLKEIVKDASADDIAHMAEGITLYVSTMFQERFPEKPIIPALGNTDSNCGDYKIEPGGDYLKTIKETFRGLVGQNLLHQDFDESFEAGGYYALTHPTSDDAVIIVLNNIFWSAKYQNACGDADADPGTHMMDWLEVKLEDAAANKQAVWMIYHIPSGFDAFSTNHSREKTCSEKTVAFWQDQYEDQFRDLVLRYQEEIRIGFMGHTHHDSFRLYHNALGEDASFGRIVPAVSPIYGNSPSFQIYTYNPSNSAVLDYETYYLPDLSDVADGRKDAVWKEEYSFAEAYKVEALDLTGLAEMAADAAQPGQSRTNFAQFYPVSHGTLRDDVVDSYLCAGLHQDKGPFVSCYCQQ